jgi:hypothetical protein
VQSLWGEGHWVTFRGQVHGIYDLFCLDMRLLQFAERPWRHVSLDALIAWLLFYAGFLLYAFEKHGEFLFIDLANLVVHEGGHLLFGWCGPGIGLWGGTILQWLVPFLLAIYFLFERQTAAFVFCTFFFFENWLYTATYMADARAMVLPLVTVGDPDFAEHDWHTIFTSMGVLQYDTTIAGVVRTLGWAGMVGIVIWLTVHFLRDRVPADGELQVPTSLAS